MKSVLYQSLQSQLAALLDGEKNLIANLANASALLFDQLPEINWAGFYLLQDNELVLGPFQGKPACVRIPLGKGVCGTAAQLKKTTLVGDVDQFPGHIACDINSKSEIVIPFCERTALVGVLDIDSPVLNRFDAVDQAGLEACVTIIQTACFT